MTKTEIEVAMEILAIVVNLPDAEEAKEYARLYIKGVQAGRAAISERCAGFAPLDEKMIMNLVAGIDSRF